MAELLARSWWSGYHPGGITAERTALMFYFFHKDPDYVRCEIRPAEDEVQGYDIVITEPAGQERTEHFSTSQAAQTRWEELQRHFRNAGWFGPVGRE